MLSAAYVRQTHARQQILCLSGKNLTLLHAQPVREGWSLTVQQISLLKLCQERLVPALFCEHLRNLEALLQYCSHEFQLASNQV